MSDNHHELCPKCGLNEAEKVLDGVRCFHCGQLTLDVCGSPGLIASSPPACPICNGSAVELINPHHQGEYLIGHCKLFSCRSCQRAYTVGFSADEQYKVPPAASSTVMLSSGIVLSVNEARIALEEVREWIRAEDGAIIREWMNKYFPASLDKPAAP